MHLGTFLGGCIFDVMNYKKTYWWPLITNNPS